MKTIVITLPVYAVLFAVAESYLRPIEIPLGIALLAVWQVLLIIWAAVAVVAGSRFRFSIRLMFFVVTLAAVIVGPGLRYLVPYFTSRRAIAAIRTANGRIELEAVGPAWLRK